MEVDLVWGGTTLNRCLCCFSEYEDLYDVCPECGEPLQQKPVQPIDLLPGTVLEDRYIVGLEINQGGFGIVYKAYDTNLDSVVALKEFFVGRLATRAVGQENVIVSPKMREEYYYRKDRFLAEARSMRAYDTHESFVNVFDLFEANGTAYFVMEYIEGEDLRDRLEREGHLSQDESIYIAQETAKALQSLHRDKIIHCDVAPDNIRFTSNGHVKLMDLGAAKLADAKEKVIDIVLKPGYSPPEQYVNNDDIGPWTDIYALGATLYQMLTGIKPEESTNRRIQDQVVPPHEVDPNIPENLSNTVMRAMAYDKYLRFKTIPEFLEALNGKFVLSPAKEIKKRKRRRFTGITAAVIIAAMIAGVVFNKWHNERLDQVLESAQISIWYPAQVDSRKDIAIRKVMDDFHSTFKNIDIEVRAIPQEEYAQTVAEAAQTDSLPTLFQSDDLDDVVLQSANDLDNVLLSEQASDCLFLNQYDSYYINHKKVPLAINVPVVVVITDGPVKIDYSKGNFSDWADFGGIAYAVEDKDSLIKKNFGQDFVSAGLDKSTVLNSRENTCALLVTSTMHVSEADKVLYNYQKSYVYCDSSVKCDFMYEWSCAGQKKNEVAAAERLLSWMLGDPYQNMLMIAYCNDGQIPINRNTFARKCKSASYYNNLLNEEDALLLRN